MEKRTFEDFTLIDDELILTGDITITEKLTIKNGYLIVAGNLTINGDIKIENGHLIVSSKLKIMNSKHFYVSGDICSGNLIIDPAYYCTVHVHGDIYVAGDSSIFNELHCNEYYVLGSSYNAAILCLNCLIENSNKSWSIYAEEDIYILGSNESYDLRARDIFINGNSDLRFHQLTAFRDAYIGGQIKNCSSLNVGN